MILDLCKGVHCVDLGESFPTSIYLQKSVSIQPRTSLVKFARSPRTDPPGPPRPGVRSSIDCMFDDLDHYVLNQCSIMEAPSSWHFLSSFRRRFSKMLNVSLNCFDESL